MNGDSETQGQKSPSDTITRDDGGNHPGIEDASSSRRSGNNQNFKPEFSIQQERTASFWTMVATVFLAIATAILAGATTWLAVSTELASVV